MVFSSGEYFNFAQTWVRDIKWLGAAEYTNYIIGSPRANKCVLGVCVSRTPQSADGVYLFVVEQHVAGLRFVFPFVPSVFHRLINVQLHSLEIVRNRWVGVLPNILLNSHKIKNCYLWLKISLADFLNLIHLFAHSLYTIINPRIILWLKIIIQCYPSEIALAPFSV